MNDKEKKQLGKSVIWNTAGNLIYYASQYILLILAQRISGKTASGYLSVAMSVAAICLSLSNYGMRSFQISDFEAKYSDKTYVRSRQLTVLLAGLGCAAYSFAISYSTEQRLVILLYTAARLSEGYIDVWHAYLQKADRMDYVGILFGIRGLLTILIFGIGMAVTGKVVPVMAALAIASWLLVFLADVPPCKKQADLKNNAGLSVWMLLWECAPLAVYSMLNSSIGSVIKLVCERIVGTEAFACFNTVFAPVQIIQVGAMYVFAPFMMLFARYWDAKNKQGYYKAFALAAAAMPVLWLCGFAGAALLGPTLLDILYGSEIRAYSYLLQPAVVAAVTNIFVTILCYLLSMMRAMKGLIIGNVLGILAAAAVTVPMVNGLGLPGAAWATVAARGVQALCCLIVVLLHCRRHFSES